VTIFCPLTGNPKNSKARRLISACPPLACGRAETKRIVEEYKLDMLEHDGYLVAKGCGSLRPSPRSGPSGQYRGAISFAMDLGQRVPNSPTSVITPQNAYYSIQDKLRREHPGILLEVCNDGGRMVDFGSAAHADYFRSRTLRPALEQRAFFDASHGLSAAMLKPTLRMAGAAAREFSLYASQRMMGWVTVMQT